MSGTTSSTGTTTIGASGGNSSAAPLDGLGDLGADIGGDVLLTAGEVLLLGYGEDLITATSHLLPEEL